MRSSLFSTNKSTMLSVLAIIVIFIFCITSCRRDVKDIPDKQPGAAAAMPEGLARLIKEKGYSFSVEINRSVPAILLDKNGNEIQRRPPRSTSLRTPDDI